MYVELVTVAFSVFQIETFLKAHSNSHVYITRVFISSLKKQILNTQEHKTQS